MSLLSSFTVDTQPLALAGYAAIASSSLFYTWIWKRPSLFVSLVKPNDPVRVMYYIALLMKVIQLGISGLLFNYTMGYSWLVGAEGPVKQAVSVVLVLLILFGQDLNRRVYTLLGVDGVYYGSRFGKKLEWVTAYPYNTISDPQYVGSLCTVLGAAPFLPPSVAAWWTIQYVYLMWLESSIPVSEDDGRHASKSGKSKEAKKTS